jgi:hypothetical protein
MTVALGPIPIVGTGGFDDDDGPQQQAVDSENSKQSEHTKEIGNAFSSDRSFCVWDHVRVRMHYVGNKKGWTEPDR